MWQKLWIINWSSIFFFYKKKKKKKEKRNCYCVRNRWTEWYIKEKMKQTRVFQHCSRRLSACITYSRDDNSCLWRDTPTVGRLDSLPIQFIGFGRRLYKYVESDSNSCVYIYIDKIYSTEREDSNLVGIIIIGGLVLGRVWFL